MSLGLGSVQSWVFDELGGEVEEGTYRYAIGLAEKLAEERGHNRSHHPTYLSVMRAIRTLRSRGLVRTWYTQFYLVIVWRPDVQPNIIIDSPFFHLEEKTPGEFITVFPHRHT